MKRFQTLLDKCEHDIRSGRATEIKGRMKLVQLNSVPREFRAPLARICRRAGLYTIGLRLLHRVINPGRKGFSTPTPVEMAEYAILLLRSGAIAEAIEKLCKIDLRQVPDAALYQAYGHFIRWEYAEAVPLLKNYINAAPNDYAVAVGKANLAYAYVELRQHREASELLNRTILELESMGHSQLQSNCHALLAQVFLQEGDFAQARSELQKARQAHGEGQSNDQALVAKLALTLSGLEFKSLRAFDELRELARKNKDWEAMREADLFSLKVQFEHSRFLHLYFGTPFEGFRRRILEELKVNLERETYVLGGKSAPRFDLLTGTIDGRQALTPGTKCHQLFEILLRDFYQPLSLGSLFSSLFPGEAFDIGSSPDRIHQVIRRTRRWLESHHVPVELHEDDGFYSLRITGQFSFRVNRERRCVDHMNLHFLELRRAFEPGQVFTARKARHSLKLSKTTVFRLMNWGLSAGKIERMESGERVVAYKILKSA